MTIEVIKGDITGLEVDAIVNAAKNTLLGGGGVDGAIHKAGGPAILEACKKIGYCETGEVVRTTSGDIGVKHLIHTVGPIWGEGLSEAEASTLLASCYGKSLLLAGELGCKSIAFPNISTGVYGFPKDLAVDVVYKVMQKAKESAKLEEVIFCCFDEENFNLYKEKFKV